MLQKLNFRLASGLINFAFEVALKMAVLHNHVERSLIRRLGFGSVQQWFEPVEFRSQLAAERYIHKMLLRSTNLLGNIFRLNPLFQELQYFVMMHLMSWNFVSRHNTPFGTICTIRIWRSSLNLKTHWSNFLWIFCTRRTTTYLKIGIQMCTTVIWSSRTRKAACSWAIHPQNAASEHKLASDFICLWRRFGCVCVFF